MSDRRAFLAGAGAAVLALFAGVPAAETPDFDPGVILDEPYAVGLDVQLSMAIGPDAGEPYYSVTPARGWFTRAQLNVMARWATALKAEPHRGRSLEAYLAEFEAGMSVKRGSARLETT